MKAKRKLTTNQSRRNVDQIGTRNRLAYIVIAFTAIGIVWVSYLYHTDKCDPVDEKIFSTLIPLFATWVGTILAFYFGRENFEAATKRYDEIINRLTPELLDDIPVNQIMISRKTMISLNLKDAKNKNIKDLIDYLDLTDKSRLPILSDEKPKYIIHKSFLLEALSKQETGEMSFDDFVAKYPIVGIIKTVREGDILENVRSLMRDNSDVKDVFAINAEGKVTGWLTDVLIMRFIQE